jgi:hypothetical protein
VSDADKFVACWFGLSLAFIVYLFVAFAFQRHARNLERATEEREFQCILGPTCPELSP